jgi:hypothetical protein
MERAVSSMFILGSLNNGNARNGTREWKPVDRAILPPVDRYDGRYPNADGDGLEMEGRKLAEASTR